jgi:hypothetical protein
MTFGSCSKCGRDAFDFGFEPFEIEPPLIIDPLPSSCDYCSKCGGNLWQTCFTCNGTGWDAIGACELSSYCSECGRLLRKKRKNSRCSACGGRGKVRGHHICSKP